MFLTGVGVAMGWLSMGVAGPAEVVVVGMDAGVSVRLPQPSVDRGGAVEVRVRGLRPTAQARVNVPTLGLWGLPLGRSTQPGPTGVGTLFTVPDHAPAGPHAVTVAWTGADGQPLCAAPIMLRVTAAPRQ